MILDGKRILVTGVLTKDSIAYSVAERAQLAGAEVVLTSFGRVRRLTERAARRLPEPADVFELDVTSEDDIAALSIDIEQRWDGLDGIVHSVAFAPPDALGGNFLRTPEDSAVQAFGVSAFSFKSLASGLLPLLERDGKGGSIVGLDFDASVAWPVYDWMGVAKAALEATNRYVARYVGASHVRANLVSAGPVATVAAQAIPGFAALADGWSAQAPLGWDAYDQSAVADAICFLLSDAARGISGEILHVDGGFHAMGGPVPVGSSPITNAKARTM